MIHTITHSDVAKILAPRPRICHKGDFGTVALFGGSVKYSGAVKLAHLACAAMRGGCGVVRLSVEDALVPAVLPHLLESTLAPYAVTEGLPDALALDDALRGVRAVGCGMGWEANVTTRATLHRILTRAGCPVLADAGALRVLAENELWACVHTPLILTPHPGEFAALAGISADEVVSSPVSHAEKYAVAHGCTVILKGATTLITDGTDTYEVDRGGAGMATAGSGDVLAGVLTGMLGYLAPTPRNLAAGVYLTGLAGEIAERTHPDITMIASDTVQALPHALTEIRSTGG